MLAARQIRPPPQRTDPLWFFDHDRATAGLRKALGENCRTISFIARFAHPEHVL
jgi:hypothetical protein